MVFRANRRWLCLLTALLFAVSGVAHAYAMTDAAIKMPSATMESAMPDQSMPDHGMDCGGGDQAGHADCIAMCATTTAILSELVAVPFVVAMQGIVAAAELPPSSGGPSPDPHPPKR
jgi:hypothetical protein